MEKGTEPKVIQITVKNGYVTIAPQNIDVSDGESIRFNYEAETPAELIFPSASPFEKDRYRLDPTEGRNTLDIPFNSTAQQSFAFYVTTNPSGGGTVLGNRGIGG